MKYTVRFAHLEKKPKWKKGQTINRGDVVGRMGSTGQSTANHLHLDCAQGEQTRLFHLSDYDTVVNPAPRQLLYFIDDELFGVQSVVTTPYAEVEYFQKRGKVHHGLDIVPWNRKATDENFDIHWNRSKPGTVTLVGYDPKGYGHYIYVTFDA